MKYRLLFIFLSFMSIVELMSILTNIKENWFILALALIWLICIQLREYIIFVKVGQLLLIILELILLNVIQYQLQAIVFAMITLESFTLILGERIIGWPVFKGILFFSTIVMLIDFKSNVWIPVLILLGLIVLLQDFWMIQQQQRIKIQNAQRENEQMRIMVRELQNQMTSSKEMYTLMERHRISREMHDSIGHRLSTIIIQLGAMVKISEKQLPQLSEMADTLRTFAKDSLQEVRKVLHDMKPQQLQTLTIISSLQEFVDEAQKNTPFNIYFRHNQPLWVLNEQQTLALFRIVQEFVANTTKYASASQLLITLIFQEMELVLTLKDDGVGYDETMQPRMGIVNMYERAKEINADIVIESEKGKGVQLRLVLVRGENNE